MTQIDPASETTPSAIKVADLNRLSDLGVLPAKNYLLARQLLIDRPLWRKLIRLAVLAFACAHLLAGVIFFFAFNWADLPVWAKLALPQFGLIMSAVIWWRLGMDSAPAQCAGIAVTVFIGLSFTVYGQTYQTGADAYELFVGWSALSLPFVLAARSFAHWLIWLALVNLSVALFLIGAPSIGPFFEREGFFIMGFVNLIAFLCFFESRARWSIPSWFAYPVLLLAFALLLFIGILGLFDGGRSDGRVNDILTAFVPAFVAVVALHGYSIWRKGQFALFALSAFAVMIFIVALAIKGTFELLDFDEIITFVALGIEIPAIVACLIVYLRRAWARWEATA